VSEQLLTPDDVAKRWGVHRATVLRLFHAGRLAGVTIVQGRCRSLIRFRPEVIFAWEKRKEREAQHHKVESIDMGVGESGVEQ
jgi:excisionase family DNA binding protein